MNATPTRYSNTRTPVRSLTGPKLKQDRTEGSMNGLITTPKTITTTKTIVVLWEKNVHGLAQFPFRNYPLSILGISESKIFKLVSQQHFNSSGEVKSL
jgi:hypothetical protein